MNTSGSSSIPSTSTNNQSPYPPQSSTNTASSQSSNPQRTLQTQFPLLIDPTVVTRVDYRNTDGTFLLVTKKIKKNYEYVKYIYTIA